MLCAVFGDWTLVLNKIIFSAFSLKLLLLVVLGFELRSLHLLGMELFHLSHTPALKLILKYDMP
jgi:hypothetical protein